MKERAYSLFFRGVQFVRHRTDPVFLVFLLLLTNYRYSFKLAALAGIYLLRPNFRIRLDGVVLFYILFILLGVFNFFFVSNDHSFAHGMTVLAGCLIWTLCLLTYHQIRHFVATTSTEKIENTLKVMVILNFIVSVFDLLRIMYLTGTINPYTQVASPPFGVSSGDMVGGVFGKLHLVNTAVCCMMTVYFIYRRQFLFTLLSIIPFLLTGSNLATLILCGFLLLFIFLVRNLERKYYALCCIPLIYLFYIKVTPDNHAYLAKTLLKLSGKGDTADVALSPLVRAAKVSLKQKTKQELIYQYIDYRKKQAGIVDDSTSENARLYKRLKLLEEKRLKDLWKMTDLFFYRKDSLQRAKLNNPFFEYGNLQKFDLEREPGKITSFKQTAAFMQKSTSNMLFGGGIGSFSSRLAFVVSRIVDDSRLLSLVPYYETEDFKNNHKAIFKYLMFLDDETHSITNLPFCWYNEMFGEYGLLGALIFAACYLGFFLRRFLHFSYGRLLLCAIVMFLLFDYWYQRLAVMVLFELLMLLDLKIRKEESPTHE